MKNFNFDGVARIMKTPCKAEYDDDGNIIKYDYWRIFDGHKLVIPSVDQLKDIASDLLDEVMCNTEDVTWVGTAGFRAIKRYDILELDFVLESWHDD